jgi:hypothetical protein
LTFSLLLPAACPVYPAPLPSTPHFSPFPAKYLTN